MITLKVRLRKGKAALLLHRAGWWPQTEPEVCSSPFPAHARELRGRRDQVQLMGRRGQGDVETCQQQIGEE